MLIGLVLRIRTVFTDDGIYWPDEIYQSFEPAHKLVFGYGIMPWEFISGARSWAMPALIAMVLKLTSLFGGHTPNVYISVVKLVFCAVSMIATFGVYRLSQILSADSEKTALASAAAASVWALCAMALYFSPRAMSENASAATIIWGLCWALDPKSSKRLIIAGASLLGISVLFRLQAGVICVAVVTMLFAARKESPRWQTVLFVLLAWAVFFGLLDAATWHNAPNAKFGGLFHSVFVYVRFNIIEGQGAARWGSAPWQYYAKHLWATMPAITAVLLVGTVLAVKRSPGLVLMSFAFIALHAIVAHKELRFLLPVLPVLCALTGYSLTLMSRIPALKLAVPATVGLAALSAYSAPSLTMGDLGSYETRPQSSAWQDFANVNRLLIIAGEQSDICGLRIDAVHLAWTGGSTYFHKPVPLYMPGYPVNAGHFNYAIVGPGSGAEVIAQDHGLELVKIAAPCTPDPAYTWVLP